MKATMKTNLKPLINRILCAGILAFLLFFSVTARAAGTLSELEDGDSGEDLRVIQEQLIALGHLDDKADGVYGPKTGAALQSWCREEGADPADTTLLDVLVHMQNHRYVKTISKDPLSVYITQRMLSVFGLLSGKIDSLYGGETEEALASYKDYAGEALTSFLKEKEKAYLKRRQTWPLYRIQDARNELVQTLTGREAEDSSSDGKVLLTKDMFEFLTTSGFIPVGDTVGSGYNGDDARRIQQRLKKLRYLAAGIDGSFGNNSVLALKYFQKRNGLKEDGICAEETWKVLLSERAKPSDQYVSPYMAKVDTDNCRVRILAWDGDGYNEVVKKFICSTGASRTPTIKGTFQASGPIGDWYYMQKSKVWVRYAFQIKGNYLFHSVLFNEKGAKHPTSSSVNNLGANVSHGCVRLSVEDAKWIYNNCSKGMTVVIE